MTPGARTVREGLTSAGTVVVISVTWLFGLVSAASPQPSAMTGSHGESGPEC
jgi:hypothetical protein